MAAANATDHMPPDRCGRKQFAAVGIAHRERRWGVSSKLLLLGESGYEMELTPVTPTESMYLYVI